MSHRIESPKPNEIVSISVNSPFLLVGEGCGESSSLSLMLSAGQGPTGVAVFCVRLHDSDYGREIVAALQATINGINHRWGLPESAAEGRFTGK